MFDLHRSAQRSHAAGPSSCARGRGISEPRYPAVCTRAALWSPPIVKKKSSSRNFKFQVMETCSISESTYLPGSQLQSVNHVIKLSVIF